MEGHMQEIDKKPIGPKALKKKFLNHSIIRKIYTLYMPKGHWTRIVMNRSTEKLIKKISPSKLDVLEISGDDWRHFPFNTYKSIKFPDFDICNSKTDEKFDLIIAEQVFEHLLWPYRAGKNVYEMLNPGGYFLITTPFLLRIHNSPADCSRWTETGMKYFLAECGFPLQYTKTGSWGNRACVRKSFSRWPLYLPWLHSLRNEPNFPVVVWALSKK
jgi:SAM-dependent methyltransferase